LIGTIKSYLNFNTVKRRKLCVDKVNQLRKELFVSGEGTQIRIVGDVEGIGFDEDQAFSTLKKRGVFSTPEIAQMSDLFFKVLVAIAFIVSGPSGISGTLHDYKQLRKLEMEYEQCICETDRKG
jgi:hypothetical protein